jgi:hypothetical protein
MLFGGKHRRRKNPLHGCGRDRFALGYIHGVPFAERFFATENYLRNDLIQQPGAQGLVSQFDVEAALRHHMAR